MSLQRIVASVLGALTAAIGTLLATPGPLNWRSGGAAAIAFLAALGVPSIHGLLTTSAGVDLPPSAAATVPLIAAGGVTEGTVPPGAASP